MNTSSKYETFPKLMASTYKLVEPVYIKNSILRQLQHDSKIYIEEKRNSVAHSPLSKLTVESIDNNILGLTNSLDFSQRNFASNCDRSFSNLTNYHQSQKFGLRMRLVPLQRTSKIENDVLEHDEEEYTEIMSDERKFYKKIYRHDGIPMMVLFKGFEIQNVQDFEELNPHGALTLDYQTTLSILNTYGQPEEFFNRYLQLLEAKAISIKMKGLQSLSTRVASFSQTDMPLVLMLKHDNGYFRVSFPQIELYVQDAAYRQQIPLSPQQTYDLITKKFEPISELLSAFDLESYKLQLNHKPEERDLKTPIERPVTPPIKPVTPPPVHKILSELGLVIKKHQSEFPEQILKKKQLKTICRFNDLLHEATFIPSQIIIKEKVSQKTIKSYFPTLQEYSDLLVLSTTVNVLDILKQQIELTFNMESDQFDFKYFKTGTSITNKIPSQPLIQEVTMENLNNGILEQHQYEIEINNKDIVISIIPATFNIYEQTQCKRLQWVSTINELNELIKNKFSVVFQII